MIYTILSVHEDSAPDLIRGCFCRNDISLFVCPQVIFQMCTDDFLRNQLKKTLEKNDTQKKSLTTFLKSGIGLKNFNFFVFFFHKSKKKGGEDFRGCSGSEFC